MISSYAHMCYINSKKHGQIDTGFSLHNTGIEGDRDDKTGGLEEEPP